jgi:hypothetical protein
MKSESAIARIAADGGKAAARRRGQGIASCMAANTAIAIASRSGTVSAS